MQNVRDHTTGELFNRWSHLGPKRLKRLQSSWAEVFRTQVLPRLPSDQLSEAFDSSLGRPTIDLPVALGVIILQQMFNLTDRETVDELGFNISWHYALDIRSDADLEMTGRTLRSYRKLVMERGLDELMFREVTDGLIDALGVDTSKQRMDSTAFRSAMRLLTRLGTFVESTSKFLRELRRKAPEEFKRVDAEVVRKYIDRRGEGCFGARPFETRERLPEAAETLRKLVEKFRATKVKELDSFRLMKRVFDEQCEICDDDTLRIKAPDEMSSDHMTNPSDPDSTYNGYKGHGYTAQLMETFTENDPGEKTSPDIITYVDVHKMTRSDTRALKPALDEVEERGIKPDLVVADTLYGTDANRADTSRRGVKLIAPTQPPKDYKSGKLSLEHFDLSDKGLVVKCPAGHPPISVNAMEKQIDARFEKSVCAVCDLRAQCPCGIQAGRGKGPRLWYKHARVGRRSRLLYERTPEFRKKYRWRAGIEATISRLKNWLKLGSLRVRGRPSVALALRMKALGLNILRCVAFL